MATPTLADLLDRAVILDLAGPVFFDRGVDYLDEGRVASISGSDRAIEGTVVGADVYSVRIAVEGGSIAADCSCPMGQTGAFCKHCVALSLAWLGEAMDDPGESDRPADSVDAFLAGLDRDALERLIVDEMARDEGFAARLHMRAAMASPETEGVGALKRALDRATQQPGILRYREVPGYAANAHEAADTLERLIHEGRADVAIGLAERTLHRVEQVLEEADDSDGFIGDLLVRLEAIHLVACRAAPPEPIALAERLFRWELEGPWDVFRGAAERYAEVLGEAGLERYRHLAEAAFEAVPSLGPGDEDDTEESIDRFNLTYMMEALARASGDVDMEIAAMSRDLSSAYDYLRIAQVCKTAGRDDESLSWAERGVQAFPDGTRTDLAEFLAEAYLARSRDDDAMALIWTELCEHPSLVAYQRLKHYADRIGAWATWRPRAIEEVRRVIAQEMAAAPPLVQPTRWLRRYAWHHPADGSLLVEILLWEDELGAAWDEARALGCRRSAWLQLATRSEETRPEDAVAVYRQEIEALHEFSNKGVYAQVVDLVGRIGRLMTGLDRSAEFADYAAGVRAANARRPAFLALFDAAGFPTARPALRLLKG